MTGPEHYVEAERLVRKAGTRPNPEVAAFDLKAAHVHAMLAMSAATIDSGRGAAAVREWLDIVCEAT